MRRHRIQVTGDDKVYNLFEADGERQQVFVGQFSDLRTQKISSLGGIPIEAFRRAYDKSFDGPVTAFTAPALKGQEPQKEDFVRPLPLWPYCQRDSESSLLNTNARWLV